MQKQICQVRKLSSSEIRFFHINLYYFVLLSPLFLYFNPVLRLRCLLIADLPSMTIKTYVAVILARMMLKRIEHWGLGSCLLFPGEIFALNFAFSTIAKSHYKVMFSKKSIHQMVFLCFATDLSCFTHCK